MDIPRDRPRSTWRLSFEDKLTPTKKYQRKAKNATVHGNTQENVICYVFFKGTGPLNIM